MKKGFCYVVHPDNDRQDWQLIFDALIEPAARAAGFTECVLGRPFGGLGVSTEDIVEAMIEAELVIVDVSGYDDPLVFYQLGVRHARSCRTILIAQDQAHIPPVFATCSLLPYTMQNLQNSKIIFRENLGRLVGEILKTPEKPDNPVLRHIQHIELQNKFHIQEQQQQRRATSYPPIDFKRVS